MSPHGARARARRPSCQASAGMKPRLSTRQQQVALDQMSEAEIRIRAQYFFYLGQGGIDLIVLDGEQCSDKQHVGLEGWDRRTRAYRLAHRRVPAHGAGGHGGAQRGCQAREQRRAEHCRSREFQLPDRSCWMSHLSPFLTMTSVLLLVTFNPADL